MQTTCLDSGMALALTFVTLFVAPVAGTAGEELVFWRKNSIINMNKQNHKLQTACRGLGALMLMGAISFGVSVVSGFASDGLPSFCSFLSRCALWE
jgi:hypothetical protein